VHEQLALKDEVEHSAFGKVTSKKVKNVKNAFFEM